MRSGKQLYKYNRRRIKKRLECGLEQVSGSASSPTYRNVEITCNNHNKACPQLLRVKLNDRAAQHRVATDSPIWAISPFGSGYKPFPVYRVRPLRAAAER